MWHQIILLLLVIVFGLYSQHRKKFDYFAILRIPHLPPVFFFGNMAPIIFRIKHRFSIIKELYHLDSDAKYTGFYEFTTPVFVIRDPELIKDITIKNFDHFTNHSTIINENQEPLLGKSLFFLTGEEWRNVRNVLSPSFTSNKMKMMFGLVTKCAEDFSNHVAMQAKENVGNVLEMKDTFSKYTNDVIASCAFGINTDSIKNPNNQFYTLGKRAVTLDGIFAAKFFFMRAFPLLAYWLGMTLLPPKIKNFFTSVIQNVISTRQVKGISRPDMIQMLMDARDDPDNKVKLNIDEISAHAFQFYFGGFDNSANSSGFMAYELAVNPHVQQRLQEEIDQVMVTTKGKPSYEDINKMPYLDAVYHESHRVHPLIDVLDRQCTKSFELPPALPGLKPVTVKPGTSVWLSVAGVQTDPQYYENPDNFDPDRFLTKKSTTTQSTYLGFGIGPRMCIGNRFAIMQTKVMFFHLLDKCTLTVCSRTEIPIELDPTTLVVTANRGFWLEIKPRKSTVDL